ncbi:hypothetical protein BASA81_001178 [Batrachochytrium salamandrivorans]|nr:hypothetical protein BASA81_001178 [Batrachochytrium salamandrivorans]
MSQLFVRQLSFSTSAESLRPLFERYGEVVEVKVPLESQGRCKGFGFVTFRSHDDAARAIHGLNGQYFEGKTIAVAMSDKRAGPPPPSQHRGRSPPPPPRHHRERSPPRRSQYAPLVAAAQHAPTPVAATAQHRPAPSERRHETSMDGKIYVSGLPPHTTEEMLAEHFSMSGKIARKRQARGYPDQWPPNIKLYVGERGEFRGDALVTYEDPNASLTAPGFYDGGDFHGSTISVQLAKKDY